MRSALLVGILLMVLSPGAAANGEIPLILEGERPCPEGNPPHTTVEMKEQCSTDWIVPTVAWAVDCILSLDEYCFESDAWRTAVCVAKRPYACVYEDPFFGAVVCVLKWHVECIGGPVPAVWTTVEEATLYAYRQLP